MSILLKSFFLSILLSSCILLQAQNIVPNSSFEYINICDEFHSPCSPGAWFAANKKNANGYYHPNNAPAASGGRYLALAVVKADSTRQYWETMLLCGLTAGEKYEVSVKIAAGKTGPNMNDIGFYFTNRFISSDKDTLLQPAGYLPFRDAKVTKLENNWFLLSKEFTALTGARFLIIGNFSPESNSSIFKKRNNRDTVIRLLVDDIVISPENRITCPGYKKTEDSLFSITKRHSIDTGKVSKAPDTGLAAKPAKTDTLRLNNVLFALNSYVLIHPDTLEAFRPLLTNPAIKRIQVIGYADDSGKELYNKELSAKRAEEITRLLAEKFGVPAALIQAEGKGVSTYYTDKSLNRRVDIYIYY